MDQTQEALAQVNTKLEEKDKALQNVSLFFHYFPHYFSLFNYLNYIKTCKNCLIKAGKKSHATCHYFKVMYKTEIHHNGDRSLTQAWFSLGICLDSIQANDETF